MKKVFLTLGLFAFLLGGVVALESVNMNQIDKVVYDDPPKAEKKSDKGCADYSMKKSSKCCASKSMDMGKKECSDKKETKTASATTDTQKDGPDKK